MKNLGKCFIAILSVCFLFNTSEINALYQHLYSSKEFSSETTITTHFINFLKSPSGTYYLDQINLYPILRKNTNSLLYKLFKKNSQKINIRTKELHNLINYLNYNYWLYNNMIVITSEYHPTIRYKGLKKSCISLILKQIPEDTCDNFLKILYQLGLKQNLNIKILKHKKIFVEIIENNNHLKYLLYDLYTFTLDKHIKMLKNFIEEILEII